MSNIFTNPEVKKHIILALIFQLIFSLIILTFFYLYNVQINKKIIEQNTAIVGVLSSIEEYDVNRYIEVITKEVEPKYIEEGKNILSKYGYDNDLRISNQTILVNQTNYTIILIIMCLLMCIPILILIVIQYRTIYGKINKISEVAEKVLDKKTQIVADENQEGSIGVLAHRINQINTKVKSSFEDLNKDKEKLKETISDISHQLKTPLSSLSVYNELLLNSPEMKENERVEFLLQASVQLQRMEWLTISLLKMARFDAGAIEFVQDKVCLMQPCREAIDNLSILANQSNCTVEFIEEENACIIGDTNWLCEAITNILKNCIEHSGKGGKVTVCVSKTPLFSRITIYDNGPGLDKNDLPHIFKRFYKGKSSVKPQSIGIGLALSKIIIEEHKGILYAGNRKQGGAEFQITFLNKT